MNQYPENQYDDDLTVGAEDLTDDYYGDPVDLFEFGTDDESPITRLKSLVLSLDWEITDEVLLQFNEELLDLKDIWASEKVNLVYLQALEKISKYIYQKKADAHPTAINLLLAFFHNLDRIVSSPNLSDDDKKQILVEDLKRFEGLKRVISQEMSRGDSTVPVSPVKASVKTTGSEKAAKQSFTASADTADKGDDLRNLKATILGLDWEITDQELLDLKREVIRLEEKFSDSRPKLILLQGIGTLGAYIKVKKSDAHADAFKLLYLFYESLEEIVKKQLTLEDEKGVLFAAVEKFNAFKALLGNTISPESLRQNRDENDSVTTESSSEGELTPALADVPDDTEDFESKDENQPGRDAAQDRIVSHLERFFGEEGHETPEEATPATPAPIVQTNEKHGDKANNAENEDGAVAASVAGFFDAQETTDSQSVSVPKDIALQGVDVEVDDEVDDDFDDDATESVAGLQPALSGIDSDVDDEALVDEPLSRTDDELGGPIASLSPVALGEKEDITTAPDDASGESDIAEDLNREFESLFGNESGPLAESTSDESFVQIDRDIALQGVDVETEADDDSDEEALLRFGNELAPALTEEDFVPDELKDEPLIDFDTVGETADAASIAFVDEEKNESVLGGGDESNSIVLEDSEPVSPPSAEISEHEASEDILELQGPDDRESESLTFEEETESIVSDLDIAQDFEELAVATVNEELEALPIDNLEDESSSVEVVADDTAEIVFEAEAAEYSPVTDSDVIEDDQDAEQSIIDDIDDFFGSAEVSESEDTGIVPLDTDELEEEGHGDILADDEPAVNLQGIETETGEEIAEDEQDEIPTGVEVEAALSGVDVESDADDDSLEAPLPTYGEELAPALSESFEDVAPGARGVDDESEVDNILERIDGFFGSDNGSIAPADSEETVEDGITAELTEDIIVLAEDDVAEAFQLKSDNDDASEEDNQTSTSSSGSAVNALGEEIEEHVDFDELEFDPFEDVVEADDIINEAEEAEPVVSEELLLDDAVSDSEISALVPPENLSVEEVQEEWQGIGDLPLTDEESEYFEELFAESNGSTSEELSELNVTKLSSPEGEVFDTDEEEVVFELVEDDEDEFIAGLTGIDTVHTGMATADTLSSELGSIDADDPFEDLFADTADADELEPLVASLAALELQLDEPIFQEVRNELASLEQSWAEKPVERMFLHLITAVLRHLEQYRFAADDRAFPLMQSLNESLQALSGWSVQEQQAKLLQDTMTVLEWQQQLVLESRPPSGEDVLGDASNVEPLFDGIESQVGENTAEHVATATVTRSENAKVSGPSAPMENDRIVSNGGSQALKDEMTALRKALQGELAEMRRRQGEAI